MMCLFYHLSQDGRKREEERTEGRGKDRGEREDRHASGVTRKMEEEQNDGRGTTVTPLA
jgi:hypothetical protein